MIVTTPPSALAPEPEIFALSPESDMVTAAVSASAAAGSDAPHAPSSSAAESAAAAANFLFMGLAPFAGFTAILPAGAHKKVNNP